MILRKIKHLDAVPANKLAPHPDAQLPMDEEDKSSIHSSIMANGVIHRLTVVADEKDGHYLVIDGRNRFEQGKEAGRDSFDCEVVECDDVHAFALELIASGRKRSVSQRIFAYLELHPHEVLDSAAKHGKSLMNLRRGHVSPSGNESEQSGISFGEFSESAIAERLNTNRHDVRAGIELLRALNGDAKVATLAEARETRRLVMEGSKGLRGWKSSAPGKEAEQHGRASTNFARLAVVYPGTLTAIFKDWDKMQERWTSTNTREMSDAKFDEAYALIPESHRAMIRGHMPQWPIAERKAALKALKASLKTNKKPAK